MVEFGLLPATQDQCESTETEQGGGAGGKGVIRILARREYPTAKKEYPISKGTWVDASIFDREICEKTRKKTWVDTSFLNWAGIIS